MLFISTYCGNLGNDNKTEKDFVKHPFHNAHRRNQKGEGERGQIITPGPTVRALQYLY